MTARLASVATFTLLLCAAAADAQETRIFYSLAHTRQNFAVFRTAGGKGAFLEFRPPADGNGHRISSHPDMWREEVDRYLRDRGLPAAR